MLSAGRRGALSRGRGCTPRQAVIAIGLVAAVSWRGILWRGCALSVDGCTTDYAKISPPVSLRDGGGPESRRSRSYKRRGGAKSFFFNFNYRPRASHISVTLIHGPQNSINIKGSTPPGGKIRLLAISSVSAQNWPRRRSQLCIFGLSNALLQASCDHGAYH